MAAPQTQEGAQPANPLMTFLPFILIFVVFYFLFIRPQSKKQKEHANMVNALQKGDKVITAGGLIGTVVGVTDDIVTLRFGEGFKAEVGKSYITGKISGEPHVG
ncbi:MAG TPA: preprotein translocase subunit YajC [candidate division Zixibacteria bacterium]|nr:preprotein translocase subunit YajC [candidate division Zixibacteria bacterium]